MPGLLDPFVPDADARERHAVRVRAPAALVYRVARDLDLHSVALVRFLFWMRGRLMRSAPTWREPQPFLEEMLALGWSCLLERAGARR